MAKAQLKTRPNAASVSAFISSIEDPDMRRDCRAVMKLMKAATGKRAQMWGATCVGYGKVHLRYASGRELDWFLTGFAPRKQNLTLYIASGFAPHKALMKKLGKYRTGVSCLYVKRLDEVDPKVLARLIRESVKAARSRAV